MFQVVILNLICKELVISINEIKSSIEETCLALKLEERRL